MIKILSKKVLILVLLFTSSFAFGAGGFEGIYFREGLSYVEPRIDAAAESLVQRILKGTPTDDELVNASNASYFWTSYDSHQFGSIGSPAYAAVLLKAGRDLMTKTRDPEAFSYLFRLIDASKLENDYGDYKAYLKQALVTMAARACQTALVEDFVNRGYLFEDQAPKTIVSMQWNLKHGDTLRASEKIVQFDNDAKTLPLIIQFPFVIPEIDKARAEADEKYQLHLANLKKNPESAYELNAATTYGLKANECRATKRILEARRDKIRLEYEVKMLKEMWAASDIKEKGSVKEVSDANVDGAIKNGLVVVDLFTTWCGPCKQLKPVLELMAGKYKNCIKFVSMDVEKNIKLNAQYVPTLVFFRNGKQLFTESGFGGQEKLDEIISKKFLTPTEALKCIAPKGSVAKSTQSETPTKATKTTAGANTTVNGKVNDGGIKTK